MSRRLLAYGDRAVLAELDTLEDVLELREALERTRPRGIIDIIPAARTVTVTLDPAVLPIEAARSWLADARPRPAGASPHETVTIDVEYSGEDIENVARILGISVEEVIRLHTESEWHVAFGGFAPGFGYLVTDHDRLVVPRMDSPRTSVPAGSVALAGEFSGVYPRSGPGGWRLIGTTDAVLFDPARDTAAVLRPGVAVRFRAVGLGRSVAELSEASRAAEPPVAESVEASGPSESRVAESVEPAAAGLTGAPESAMHILESGPLTLIEDLGRPGNANVGAARSGALDRGALRLANRLVGNGEGAAALEILVGGFAARIEKPLWFAVTGALAPVSLDGRAIEPDEPARAEPGQTLRIGAAQRGLRSYLAVRGGVVAAPALGSRSRDILAEIGPAPLMDGDMLAVGPEPAAAIPAVDTMTVSSPTEGTVTIRVLPGPREHWFTAAALEYFYDAEWTVTTHGNRTGIRLAPASVADGSESGGEGTSGADHVGATGLQRAVAGELPSEAMVAGAIQVPPSGQPTVLLADHPTTGGYPVIAVVTDASLDSFAQLRPGQRVAFRHSH